MMKISTSLQTLLTSRPRGEIGGFVVFEWGNDFLQFSLEPNGLMFNWPILNQDQGRAANVIELLTGHGFTQVAPSADVRAGILALRPQELYLADDGIYAQCGADLMALVALTETLMKQLLDVREEDLTDIKLELDG